MRLVWSSVATGLGLGHGHAWPTVAQALGSWALSLLLAERHSPERTLFGDRESVDLLVNRLGLNFTEVRPELDAPPAPFWNAGKLQAAKLAARDGRPFAHVDGDVFLRAPLPDRVQRAEVFAEHNLGTLEQSSRARAAWERHSAGWMPGSWTHPRHLACGLFGGTNTTLLGRWAQLAIEFIQAPENTGPWLDLEAEGAFLPVIAEECSLSSFMHEHGQPVELLLSPAPFTFGWEPRPMWQHAVGTLKRAFGPLVERELRHDYPDTWARCEAVAREISEC